MGIVENQPPARNINVLTWNQGIIVLNIELELADEA